MAMRNICCVFVAAICLSTLEISQVESLKRIALKVGFFNIRHFGSRKMADEMVSTSIRDIVRKYDIILIIEVRDKHHLAMKQLSALLGRSWVYLSSPPLGRNKRYQEQYAYFFRRKNVNIIGASVFNDTDKDLFSREPYIINIEYYSRKQKQNVMVSLIGVHVQPKNAYQEITDLTEVFTATKVQYPQAIGQIAMGDLNADCGYLSDKAKETLEVFNSCCFQSFIDHDSDTTVTNSTCAYDRVIMPMNSTAFVDRVEIIKFDQMLGLSQEDALKISDHYPVMFRLN